MVILTLFEALIAGIFITTAMLLMGLSPVIQPPFGCNRLCNRSRLHYHDHPAVQS